MTNAMINNPRNNPHSHQSGSGFSLVEMMVAVAIIAILATVAIPASQNMIIQSRLSSQTNDLVGAIQAARGEAIKRNQQIRFCRTASADGTDCAGAGRWEFWIVVNTANTVLRRGSINSELRLTSTLNLGRLTFIPSGTNSVTTGNDSLTLCSPTGSGNTARLITVGLGGRTSISKTTGACS